MKRLAAGVVLLLSALSRAAVAAPGNESNPIASDIVERLTRWQDLVETLAAQTFQSWSLHMFIANELAVLSLFALFFWGFNYMRNRATFLDLIALALMIMIVTTLVAGYADLTRAVFGIGPGLASIFQEGMLGDKSVAAPLFRTMHAIEQVAIQAPNTSLLGLDIVQLIGYVVIMLAIICLIVVVAIASIWPFWGYTVFKLVGIVFIPMMILESTRAWFDNWLRIFLTFSLFDVLMRIIVSMVVRSLEIAFSITGPGGQGAPPIVAEDFYSVAVMVIFGFLGVYGIAKAMPFAGQLLGGGLAVSKSLSDLSQTAARAVAAAAA